MLGGTGAAITSYGFFGSGVYYQYVVARRRPPARRAAATTGACGAGARRPSGGPRPRAAEGQAQQLRARRVRCLRLWRSRQGPDLQPGRRLPPAGAVERSVRLDRAAKDFHETIEAYSLDDRELRVRRLAAGPSGNEPPAGEVWTFADLRLRARGLAVTVTQHLLFTLYAPYGAWGAASAARPDAQGHRARALALGADRPARGGAGLERARLPALDRALFIAVREILAPGAIRSPTTAPPRRPAARCARALDPLRGAARAPRWPGQAGRLDPLPPRALDQRSLDRRPGPDRAAEGLPIEVLAGSAARRPVWPLYAGRKACGLGLPPDPELVLADGPAAALAAYGLPWTRRPALAALLAPFAHAVTQRPPGRLLYDPDYPGAPPSPIRTVTRRDRADHLQQPSGRVFAAT